MNDPLFIRKLFAALGMEVFFFPVGTPFKLMFEFPVFYFVGGMTPALWLWELETLLFF
jgi:hypothetical protein